MRQPQQLSPERRRLARLLLRVIVAVYLGSGLAGFVIGYNLGSYHSRATMLEHAFIGLFVGAIAIGVLGHIVTVVVGASFEIRRLRKHPQQPPG